MPNTQFSANGTMQETGTMPETGGRSVPGYYNAPPMNEVMNMGDNSPNLTPQENPDAVGNPQNSQEAYLGSLQASLQNNLGYFVVMEFLIGSGLTEKEGILYSVGNNFVTLYEQETDRYIVCDLFSARFVTFFRQSPNALAYSGNRSVNTQTYGGMIPRRG